MEKIVNDPISSWCMDQVFCYFVLVFIGSLILRLLSCLLKAIHVEGYTKKIWGEFWIQFKGYRQPKKAISVDKNENDEKEHILTGDFWFPMFIGLIELSIFPVLMVTQNWTFIGAWLAFKVLPHWKAWTEDRTTFNRFLLAQGLQLIYAAMILTKFIHLLPYNCK